MPDAPRPSESARELRRRLSAFSLAPADEDSVAAELLQHVEDRVAELTRGGMGEAEARRLALEDLSNEELRRGGWRRLPALGRLPAPAPGAPSTGLIDGMRRDVRYALRSLSRQRGFATIAVLALALGIGATTAIFAAVDAVLLRPMPFPHADRLFVPVSEHHARGIARANVTFADYEEWSRMTDVFAKVAIWSPGFADVTGGGDPERVRLARVSEQFFDLIDVRPLAGRTLVPADHAPGAPPVVVMTQQFWEQRFGAAPDVIGRTVVLGGAPREIVGILPARQVWPDSVSLFVPTVPALLPEDIRTRRDNMIFGGLVRLRDGVPADEGRARLAAIAARLEQDHPDSRSGWTNTLVPLRGYIVNEDVTVALYVLLGAVVAVLLIACANVANLSLVRGSGRVREFAVRLALGASRRGLVQQLLVESALLCAVAAACGVTFALLFTRGVVAIAPAETPFLGDVGLNGRVLVFALVMTSVAAILSGLVPAISSSALRPSTALRDGSAGAGVLRRTSLRNLLVVAEIAAAVVLVSGAALLMRSFERLSRVDPGVSVDRVVTGRIAIPAARYPTPDQRARFAANVAAELARRAEIERAALGSYVPAGAGGAGLGRVFLAEGRPEPPVGTDVGAQWITVTPDYFRTLGIRLREGRAFEARDAADTTPVIIVSRRFAARMFPDEPAIGRRIRSWRDENRLREIVGVVDDVTYSGLADRERDAIYVPHAQDSGGSLLVIARSRSRDAAALGGTLRRAVQAVDKDVAVADIRPLAAAASLSIAAQRYSTLLLTILAGVALALSALGIYGVINHVFTLRRREMGIRLALGATRTDLHRLVFRQGFALMAAGLLLGLAGAAATARWIRTLLFDTAPTDPTAWLGMVLVVVLSTALACLLPARRAAAADPTITLRAD